MDAKLYIYPYDRNIVNKQNLLTFVDSVACNSTEEVSVATPEIIIDQTKPIYQECNYCYIPIYKRYYYILDKILMPGGLIKLRLATDTITSFKSSYINNAALLDRQQFKSTPTVADEIIKIPSKRKITYNVAKTTPFKKSVGDGAANICLVVNTSGGDV